jgi:hypothetical protein
MDNSSIPFDGRLLQAYLSTWSREKNGSKMPWDGRNWEGVGIAFDCSQTLPNVETHGRASLP